MTWTDIGDLVVDWDDLDFWILTTGFWDDTGEWRDEFRWNDGSPIWADVPETIAIWEDL